MDDDWDISPQQNHPQNHVISLCDTRFLGFKYPNITLNLDKYIHLAADENGLVVGMVIARIAPAEWEEAVRINRMHRHPKNYLLLQRKTNIFRIKVSKDTEFNSK